MLLEDKQFMANVATMEALGYIQKTIPTSLKIQLSKQDIETIEEILLKYIDRQIESNTRDLLNLYNT
jgi:hydroxymethylpyrimidine/phosphomethylpyrimidine kinase